MARYFMGDKKGAVGNEAGAGSEVALGRSVTVHAAGRPVAVPRVQASALPYPRPGDELNTELEGFAVKPETEEGLLPVELDGQRLCLARASGAVRYRREDWD